MPTLREALRKHEVLFSCFPGSPCLAVFGGSDYLCFIIWFCMRVRVGVKWGRGKLLWSGRFGFMDYFLMTCKRILEIGDPSSTCVDTRSMWSFSSFPCETWLWCLHLPEVWEESSDVSGPLSPPQLTVWRGWTFWLWPQPPGGHLWSCWGLWKKRKWEKLLEEEGFNPWAGVKQENASEDNDQETLRNSQGRI